MKLLLSSTDRQQVDGLAKVLFSGGIQSDVRPRPVVEPEGTLVIGVELWVRNDNDYHRAAIVCAGFTRRLQHLELWRHN
jgi:hypothetical protein